MDRAPILETERLRLRGHCESDLSDSYALWSDPVVVRYIGARSFTVEEVWARLLRYAGHWQLKGFGYWLVEEKGSGRFAGEVGLADFKRDLSHSLDGAPELGWALATWAHGKGYATEAAREVIRWARTNLQAERMVCLIHPENAASIRLASKLGFEELQRLQYKDSPTLLFERRRPET